MLGSPDETLDHAPGGAPDDDTASTDQILAYIEDQPLTCLAVAFLAGLIVGRLVL